MPSPFLDTKSRPRRRQLKAFVGVWCDPKLKRRLERVAGGGRKVSARIRHYIERGLEADEQLDDRKVMAAAPPSGAKP